MSHSKRKQRREPMELRASESESLARLVAMHSYCRPAGSATELEFVNNYLKPLGDVARDRYGNYSIVVGDRPELVWSCHTDTVHHRGGRQQVELSSSGVLSAPLVKLATPHEIPGYSYANAAGVTVIVPPRTQYYATGSGCLGADDTAGVWLLCELIRRGVAGRYLFHYGEEEGCQGSRALADDVPSWIADARFMVAVDRKDTGDIITHQCGGRTASDAFAWSLAAQLNQVEGIRYRPSDRGLYTDSESYAHLIPECTNLSIGYAGNHSQSETLDTGHCLRLLEALALLDTSALVSKRDPAAVQKGWVYRGGAWSSDDWPEEDPTLPVACTETFYYCYSCGASVERDDEICADCGEDDPADPYEFDSVEVATERRESRRDLRSMFQRSTYLDPAFAEVQRALGKAQAETQARTKRLAPAEPARPRGVVPSRCCRWGGCNGTGPIGGHCNRCGTAIAATEARA